jgi:branched-subunit amino acid transport protein
MLGVIPFAMIPAIIAWRTKNDLYTFVVGMTSLWLFFLL